MLIPEGCYARTSFVSIAGERLSVCSTHTIAAGQLQQRLDGRLLVQAERRDRHEARLKGLRVSPMSRGSIVRVYQSTNWTTPPSWTMEYGPGS